MKLFLAARNARNARDRTGRRRRRVLAALADAAKNGTEIGVPAIARRAGGDPRLPLPLPRPPRPDPQGAEPATTPGGHGPAVSRAFLKADLATGDARAACPAAQVRRFEQRLSEALGETVGRLIDKLKAWRGIATRCDKTPDSYLAGLHLRAAMIWIDDLLRMTD
ncbi:hypothetical protein [Kitasatospora sp. NPDC096204]|uniref:hypothetical protein n=1 Tax=Kitasatospora sp. NPDC096204 TaxID=3364094 RepID=UPI00381BFBCC